MLLDIGYFMILLGLAVGFILFTIFIIRVIIEILRDSSSGWFEFIGVGAIGIIIIGFLLTLIGY